MKVILSVASLQANAGGPPRSVSGLADGLADAGTEVALVSLNQAADPSDLILPRANAVQADLVPQRTLLDRSLQWSGSLRPTLVRLSSGKPDVVFHDNGLWVAFNHTVASVARTAHVPLVVSPRGMLTPWSLRFRGFKKRLAWRMYQKRDLESAAVLHATARQEAEEFRALRLRNPIAVIPNGVDLPPIPAPAPKDRSMRTALFLSRIHPKKGLLDLVAAWKTTSPPDWKMVVCGPDEAGHRKELERAIVQAGLASVFEVRDPVDAEGRNRLLGEADLFILPTYSENFGIAIAEALAAGLPVITTKGAPWEELVTHGCGWWADIGVEPLADALQRATDLSDDDRRGMGLRGRRLVEERYAWPHIAGQMLSAYRWVLGQGPKPDCVITD